MGNILAFETSCDDTAVAIVDEQGQVLADVIYSQTLEHAPYGGVVPEIGSRTHIAQIGPAVKLAFTQAGITVNEIDAVAATFAPGLIGPLLVGAQFAKGFALARSIPLIAIHHIEGHILSGYLAKDFPPPPFLALIVSGGHTAIYKCNEDFSISTLGHTVDDAAGEAFDKIGRALGLGYPAGKKIDELARLGDKDRFALPVAFRQSEHFNFSFSGLKTAALKLIKDLEIIDEQCMADICASLQEAICLALSEKLIKSALSQNINAVVIGGGVAANSRLRALLSDQAAQNKLNLFLPDKRYCTDNAVMIARAALAKKAKRLKKVKNEQDWAWSLDVMASLAIEEKDRLDC